MRGDHCAGCLAVRCLQWAAGGDGKGEGRQAQSFKGKTRSARDWGWAAEGDRCPSLQSKWTGRDRQLGGPEQTGQAGVCCPGRSQQGTGARTRAGALESPAGQAGAQTAPRSAGVSAHPAPSLCLLEARRRGRSRFSVPTTPGAASAHCRPGAQCPRVSGPGRAGAGLSSRQETRVLPAKSSQSSDEGRIATHMNLGPQLRRCYGGVCKTGRRGI